MDDEAWEICETCDGEKWLIRNEGQPNEEEIECPECHARGVVPNYSASRFQRGVIFSTLNQY